MVVNELKVDQKFMYMRKLGHVDICRNKWASTTLGIYIIPHLILQFKIECMLGLSMNISKSRLVLFLRVVNVVI